VIDLGRQQADHGADALAALEGLLACRGRPANGQAHAAFDRRCASSASVTTSRLETRRSIRCEGCCWLAAAAARPDSARFAAHRPGIDDRAFDGAEQAVGERGQRGRGRRVRLHPAHHAPSSSHSTASGSQAMRCARKAATPHSTATRPAQPAPGWAAAREQWVTAIPAAKSHAA
jgi:hypothetical protein